MDHTELHSELPASIAAIARHPQGDPDQPAPCAWPPAANAFGMVGQTAVCDLLEDLVGYCTATGKRFQDRLLVGPPGVGKSTLARAVARRLAGGGCVLLNAADCRLPKDFIHAIGEHGLFDEDEPTGTPPPASAGEADPEDEDLPEQARRRNVRVSVAPCVIFIDEVHVLSRPMRAWLLSALDDSRSASFGGDLYLFEKVTFLLATTDPGRLAPALISRCEPMQLKAYSLHELAAIVATHARAHLDGEVLSEPVCLEIAARMQCNPRRAVRALTNALIPYAHARLGEQGIAADGAAIARWLGPEQVSAFYDSQGIDCNGVDAQTRAVLTYLGTHGATPEARLRQAFTLTTDADFRAMDEYLLRLGLITVSTRGRALTEVGQACLVRPVQLRHRIDRQGG